MADMRRRDFVALPGALLAHGAPLTSFPDFVERQFLTILRGYLESAARTSNSLAVIEYPKATVTKSFLAKSGLSVTGVARMMPAIAAWIAGRRRPSILQLGNQTFDLLDVAGSAIVNGTNPGHKDYWGASPANEQNQRQVESSIIAWSAYLLRDTLLPQMASTERERLDEWLRSCTQRPVRRNNWAWFTAVNQAARMVLKDRFDEFSFDQRWMFEDLTALDAMYVGEGWYNDDPPKHSFDYYNSWVFASHFLYWNAMVGERYPEWAKRFGDRLRAYLATAPLFFGAHGGHILYGRSLIYRFGVLTPLVLAYAQKLWPYSPGLLQRIVYGSLDFHDRIGGYSASEGKLRETYSRDGTRDIREPYIDGGHPYWGMQAFAVFLIPPTDPFWTGESGRLPVEEADFVRPLKAPGLLVAGSKASGQVKLLQGRSSKTELHYRDKYNKFSYSSHFAPCLVQRPDVTPWDNALVLRDRRRRRSAGRGEILESRILEDGIEIAYSIVYGGLIVKVRSSVIADGEFEARLHRILAPQDIDPAMEIAEGSSAVGFEDPEQGEQVTIPNGSIVRNKKSGWLAASWYGQGWIAVGAAWDFGLEDTSRSNVVFPRFYVNTLWAPLKPGAQLLSSVHYASPKPLGQAALAAKAQALFGKLKALGGGPAPATRSTGAGSRTKPAKARP